MQRRRLSYPMILVLALGTLIPLLFGLDWAVGRTPGRQVYLDTELSIRLDGNPPLVLATDMSGGVVGERLVLAGAAPLRQSGYPWQETPFEGRLQLRLEPEFLASPTPGPRREGFTASYTVRDLTRSDGYGLPRVPCRGRVQVGAMGWTPGAEGLEGLEAAELRLDLLCTSAGPDLEFGTGDEQVWTIEGPVRMSALRQG